jgi:hypothetical protein
LPSRDTMIFFATSVSLRQKRGVIMAKTRQIQGKGADTREKGFFAWFAGLFQSKPPTVIVENEPFALRLTALEGKEDERKGYYRLIFDREDGETFQCIVDARMCERLSNDLIRAAAHLTMKTAGDASGVVEVKTGQAFDHDAHRAQYELESVAREEARRVEEARRAEEEAKKKAATK